MDAHKLEALVKRLGDALPESVKHLKQEAQDNFREVLISTLHKMDLVTREEFDVQTKVLANTRKQLQALEAQILELQQSKNSSKSS